MKNMQVWPYYISEDIVWFSDLSEGGVYTYKWESEEIDCKIRADVLFRFGIFEIAALACWESFVFIFSEELNGPHIVYNNLDGKIKRFEGLKNGCGQIIHQAIVVNNILYVVPLEIKENIYVVNLKVWNNNNNNIKLTPKKIGKGIEIKTWLPKYYDRSLFIPEYGGRRVFCVTEDKVKIIHLDIPVELFTIGVFENEIWVAPLHGKRIFCMTLEGEIKEKVEALCGYGKDTTNIWEIFFRDEFVFFLYWKRPEIDIYNKKKKIKIDGNEFLLPCKGTPGDLQYYLPNVINKNVIRFLPSRCNMLEIDLTDFTYRGREFGFPAGVSDKEWDEWCWEIRRYRYSRKRPLNEREEEGLKIFLEYMGRESFLSQNRNDQNDCVGKKIYQFICNI